MWMDCGGYPSLFESILILFSLLLEFRNCIDFPCGTDGKESVYNAGNPGWIPGLGRSPREGNGYLLQYFCLVNSMDREAYSQWGCKESDMTEQLTHFIINELVF